MQERPPIRDGPDRQINQIFGYSFCIMEGGGILGNNSDGKKSLKSYLTNLTTSRWTKIESRGLFDHAVAQARYVASAFSGYALGC